MWLSIKSWAVFTLIVSGIVLSACVPVTLADITLEELAIESMPLPDDWRVTEFASDRRREELGATETQGRRWAPSESENGGLSYAVYKFDSIVLAKQGYRVALHLLRKPGFTLPPESGWTYESELADQYTTFRGSLETTPGNCYFVARYSNLLLIVGFVPGGGVSLEQTPELFGTIDRHIQAIIENIGGD